MTLNLCQANHETHDSKLVDTAYGPLWIWDWRSYMDQPLYCPGQDEVSKSIDLQGAWERADTEFFRGVLEQEQGPVADFGSHIGWFSTQASRFECEVWAIDSDPENARLWEMNMDLYDWAWEDYQRFQLGWAEDAMELPFDHLRIMKVDIEGHEHDALNLTRHLWQERRIDYGLWELSPIFEKRPGIMAESYAALVDEIASYGYRWFILKGDDRWYIEGTDLTFPQENGWVERI